MSYLVIKPASNGQPKSYQLTSTCNNPRVAVSDSYIPLTTTTSSGTRLMASGSRVMEYLSTSVSQSASTTYKTSKAASAGLSSTTALTRASTSNTVYQTASETTGTTYYTRASTSDTKYGTQVSTTGTTYYTRASTSDTKYGTQVTTTGYSELTRADTYDTIYETYTFSVRSDSLTTFTKLLSYVSERNNARSSITTECGSLIWTPDEGAIRHDYIVGTQNNYFTNINGERFTCIVSTLSSNFNETIRTSTFTSLRSSGYSLTVYTDTIESRIGTYSVEAADTRIIGYRTSAATTSIVDLTQISTTGITYYTRASTSDTKYGTQVSTTGTTYYTRVSTSDTKYGTQAKTTNTIYNTKVSTSGYSGVSSSSNSKSVSAMTWD